MNGNVMASILDGVASRTEAATQWENEYLADDGLLHCSVCGRAKQVVVHIQIAGLVDEKKTVRCRCDCLTPDEIRAREIAEYDAAQERERRRRECFAVVDLSGKKGVSKMAGWTFAKDDRQRPDLSDNMQAYADQFQKYRKESHGLVLYGNVGTGKSYMAASIANAVIDQGYTARMVSFGQIGNEMQQTWEKQEYIDNLCKHDLLIIDDLGTERKSEYMQEIVYNVIDTRYRAGGPLIITTNLTADELSKPGEIGYARIYDRILERCLAVKVDGNSRRRQATAQVWAQMRQDLGMA